MREIILERILFMNMCWDENKNKTNNLLTLIPLSFILLSDKKEIGSELRYSRDLSSRKQEELSSFIPTLQTDSISFILLMKTTGRANNDQFHFL